jgi:hypothetical protein
MSAVRRWMIHTSHQLCWRDDRAWISIAANDEAASPRNEADAASVDGWGGIMSIGWRIATICVWLMAASPSGAQTVSSPQQHPGRTVVMSKCFQCHTDAMFRDHRADRRGWEAAIHRMIGRGGLWTEEEIKVMADFLVSELGPGAPAAAGPK